MKKHGEVHSAPAASSQEASPRVSSATPAPEDRLVLNEYGRRCYDAGRASLSAAERPAPTWQPIESAPKDGTNILLGWTSGLVMGGYWADWRGRKSWVTARGEYHGDKAPQFWLPAPPGPVAQEKE